MTCKSESKVTLLFFGTYAGLEALISVKCVTSLEFYDIESHPETSGTLIRKLVPNVPDVYWIWVPHETGQRCRIKPDKGAG